MRFAKLVSDKTPEGVEETWSLEASWAEGRRGQQYYSAHLSVIQEYETAAPIFERWLGRGGQRVLEAGCGTGRWMAFFEHLGNRAYGVDHSLEQLRFAKAHAPDFQLSGGDVQTVPFREDSFDAAFSSYVAEHFRDGPGRLLVEIRRVLRRDGLLFLVVPFASPWRRFVVHPLLRLIYALWRLRGGGLYFTEYHFRWEELQNVVRQAGFELIETHPDDYRSPWTKGLYCDVADVLAFVRRRPNRPFQFGRLGTLAVRLASYLPLWWYCEGIFVVARCRK